MKAKFTKKKIILSIILLCICVLSVTTLFYDVIKYAVSSAEAAEIRTTYGIQLSENGFDFIKGESSFSTGAFFELTGGSFSGMDILKWCYIIILIIASLSFVPYATYLFSDKKGSRYAAALIIAINLICSVLYLAVSIIFKVSCDNLYLNDADITYNGTFETYSYVPLCLSVISLLVYVVCAVSIKNNEVTAADDCGTFNNVQTSPVMYSGNAADIQQSEAMPDIKSETEVKSEVKAKPITTADIEKLIKLKKLYDDGVITEKEFTRQKGFILNK